MTGELRPNQGFVRSRFGGLPRGFWLLWAGTLVNRLGTMVQPFLAIYLHTVLGLGLAATGFEMAVFGSGQVISQLFGGWLTDLTGRMRTLAGSLFTSAAVMLFLGSVHGLPALTVGIFLLGVTIDAYRPAATALVADLVRPEDRVRAYGLLFWAVNLGFSAAMLLGGGLQDLGPRWLFLVNGLCTAAFGVVLV
jgi:MFS family permease